MEKTLNYISLAIIAPFAVWIGIMLPLWLLQTGVNKVITYTKTGITWNNCMNIQYPLEEQMEASTSLPYYQAIDVCGNSPYLSIVPN